MFDFSLVTTWIDAFLRQTLGLGDFLSILIECILVGVLILVGYAMLAIVLIFMERKVCAYFQCRLGPMRVGPWGVFQVFADVLKMLIKEIFTVDKADKLLYFVAPFLVIIASVGTFSFLPWNNGAEVLDFNVGIFLLSAISSIGIVGIFMAGWGSNNKYSVVSAMRGAVQLISYEMSLALCLIAAVVLTGSMKISEIVDFQVGPWNWLIFRGHIPAIIAFLRPTAVLSTLRKPKVNLLPVITQNTVVWALVSTIWQNTLIFLSCQELPQQYSLVDGHL